MLDNVSIHVPEQCIYGFLGPNGAGKTTTLKLILGLLRNQQGTIKIFNKPIAGHRVEIMRSVGSLIESPSVYGHLSAKDNLRIFQKVYQCPQGRIDEVLSMTGLANTGTKKAAQFSLGMKQRLGIAIALLHHPTLLILDEPTNGLDPNGMVEIREFLKLLNREHGTTILISSHLLTEIDRLATHIGLINKGRILFEGTAEQLKKEKNRETYILYKTSDNQAAAALFARQNIKPALLPDAIKIAATSKENVAGLNRLLVHNGLDVYEITTEKNDLETIFMNLITD